MMIIRSKDDQSGSENGIHDTKFASDLKAFVDLTREIFELVRDGDIKIQDGWEGVKSGFVPNTVHSSEEVTKGSRQCFC